jgi:hypothetical protein
MDRRAVGLDLLCPEGGGEVERFRRRLAAKQKTAAIVAISVSSNKPPSMEGFYYERLPASCELIFLVSKLPW